MPRLVAAGRRSCHAVRDGRIALSALHRPFGELRAVLRFAPQDLPHGQRPPRTRPSACCRRWPPTCRTISENSVSASKPPLTTASRPDPADTLVLAYLERYGTGLCGHPVVRDPSGQAIAVVARTNNLLEQHFATSKQALRLRLGRAHLGRDLADQPAQAALESPAADLPRLERNNRDAALRRRNRAWADDTIQTPAPGHKLSTSQCTQSRNFLTES